MSHRVHRVAFVAILCCALLPQSSVFAKNWGYTNADLAGSYASQWTGTVNFPAGPMAAYNGPYALVGRLVADGNGNVTAKTITSFNGTIVRNAGAGTYTVNSDGTFKMTMTFPTSEGGRNVIQNDGVLFDEGRQIRLMLSAFLEPALPPGYVGMSTSAILTRQSKSWGWSEADFCGSYAARYTGTIALPEGHPLSLLNGAFVMVGRTTADCQGSGSGSVTESFNGVVVSSDTVSMYNVSEDGWIKVTQVGEVTLVFEGVLSESGGQVYLMLTELPGAGLPAGYVGATMTGIETRQ
jgi:hypothetical protein